MYRDVSHPYSLVQFSALAATGFVDLRHEQCIKYDMSAGCKHSSPCCHPSPTGEAYTGVP